MGPPICGAEPKFSPASSRGGVGSGNHKNSGVPCLLTGRFVMKYAARASTLILAGFLAITSTCARASGPGGGHGGHSSGGSSSGHSSGHSIGHTIGHSLGHIFGHHGQRASSAALIGAPSGHGKDTPSPDSVPQVLDHQPMNRFVFQPPIGFFPRRRAFGFGGCPYGGFEHNLRFGDNWNCFNNGFSFDPSSSGWFSGALPYDSAFGGTTWFKGGTAADSTGKSPAEPNATYPPTNSDATNETPISSGSSTSSPNGIKAERPITLLQLRDGSMYGLTDYWVKDGELHYTTTYGGQNSLAFERIDFEKTVQLNADRDVPFVLPAQSRPR
jgi:hypothetical protein